MKFRKWTKITFTLSTLLFVSFASGDETKTPSPIPFPPLIQSPAFVMPPMPAFGGEFLFQWPMEEFEIIASFGPKQKPKAGEKMRIHAGVDLEASAGESILATGPGRVLHAGWYSGYGNYVLIQHENGYLSHYGHLSEISVYRGQMLQQGAVIGFIGSTGRSAGLHLHFGITKEKKWKDPEKLIGSSSRPEKN